MIDAYDCGTHPMANPTRPLNNNSQPKLGASELRNPYTNSSTPHSVSAGFRPQRSLSWPQNVELNIMPKKTMVVVSACWYRVMPQSQCSAGPSTLNMVISIESAIQQSPTHSESFTWNQPKPNAFTACVTVYVSVRTRRMYEKAIASRWSVKFVWNIQIGNAHSPSGTTLTEDISKSWHMDISLDGGMLRWEWWLGGLCPCIWWLLWFWYCLKGVPGTLAPGISSYSLITPGLRSPMISVWFHVQSYTTANYSVKEDKNEIYKSTQVTDCRLCQAKCWNLSDSIDMQSCV